MKTQGLIDKKDKHDKLKELILLVGGLVIVIGSMIMVGFLVYQSMIRGVVIPEYAIAFFSSVATLILGYLFGKLIK